MLAPFGNFFLSRGVPNYSKKLPNRPVFAHIQEPPWHAWKWVCLSLWFSFPNFKVQNRFLRRHWTLGWPQMWERVQVGFGNTGKKRKGPCGSCDTRLAEACPPKLWNTLKYRIEKMRPKVGNGRNTVSRVLFRRRELTEFRGKLGEFCEKTRWVRFGPQIIGWKELSEFAPRNSVSPKKLTELGVWNRTPRNRIRPVSPKMAILEAPCVQNAPGRSTMRLAEALLPRNPTWESSHSWGLTRHSPLVEGFQCTD